MGLGVFIFLLCICDALHIVLDFITLLGLLLVLDQYSLYLTANWLVMLLGSIPDSIHTSN